MIKKTILLTALIGLAGCNDDDNKIVVKRLSRNEKAILSTLKEYSDLGSSYQWPELPDTYGTYITDSCMNEYRNGHRVPIWMIKRDCGIKHASSLSRTLKTLLDKDLIYPHGYDMGSLKCMDPMHGSDYAKYISLSYLGYQIVKQIEPIQDE